MTVAIRGPLHVEEVDDELWAVSTETHRYVALVGCRDRFPDDCANAQLFAAAPTMLAKLKEIRQIHRPSSPNAEQFREPGYCAVCQDVDGGAARWPCETRRLADSAIKALGEEEE